MRSLLLFIAAAVVLTVAWFFVWQSIMHNAVKQVETSIHHHARAIREVNRTAAFKVDAVYATGFPYKFRVAVDRPTLTQVVAGESYGVSFERIELQSINPGEGRYRVYLPTPLDAVYAKPGQAPEKYLVTAEKVPGLMLRAVGTSMQCSNLPGTQPCHAKPTDPLITMAVQLPPNLLLDVSLNGETKKIQFQTMPVSMPIFMNIPAQVSQPLQIFVEMLRQAMIFEK